MVEQQDNWICGKGMVYFIKLLFTSDVDNYSLLSEWNDKKFHDVFIKFSRCWNILSTIKHVLYDNSNDDSFVNSSVLVEDVIKCLENNYSFDKYGNLID